MKNNFLFTLVVSLVCLAWLSCSAPAPAGNGDDEDAGCQGDGCPVDVAQEIEDIVEEEAPPDIKPDEPKKEEVDVPCNFCDSGQVKCDGDGAYRLCEENDEGCFIWSGKTQCKGDNVVCACGLLGEEICTVEDDGYCICQPQCEGKVCGPDGCGGECDPGCAEGETCVKGEECIFCNCDKDVVPPCFIHETICNGPLVQKCEDIWQDSELCEGECWTFGEATECEGEGQLCENDECSCEHEKCGDEGECCETAEYVCEAGACCLPDCGDQECGSSCGVPCGECDTEAGFFCVGNECKEECPGVSECTDGEIKCTEAGGGYHKCEPVTPECPDDFYWTDEAYACEGPGDNAECIDGECVCVPKCADKECGSDGCDGSCGDCPGGLNCCEPEDVEAGDCAYPQQHTCICLCPGNASPACDKFSNKEYASACEAECDGLVASVEFDVCGEGEYCKGACPTCEDDCTDEELETGPMCGEGMISYPSFCALMCDFDSDDCTALGDCDQILYGGECKLEYCEGCKSLGFDPVCDLDALITYNNACDLALCADYQPSGPPECGADNCEPTENLCFGECPTDEACDCPATCSPVCGKLSDTYTRSYMNECLLECAGAELLEDGPCCPGCAFDAEDWICALDTTGEVHKSFKNQCVMICKDPSFDWLYDIPKASDGSYMLFLCDACPDVDLSGVSDPICGDDFETYFNLEALNCASKFYDKEILPYDPVLCPEGACFSDTCRCPPETAGYVINSELADNPLDSGKRGVCGEDGNTYANSCHAAFYGVDVAQDKWCGSCPSDQSCAGMEYVPHCCKPNGTGWGVTFPNSCIPEKCNANIDFADCQKGKCCLADEDCDDTNPDTTDTCNVADWVCENL